MIDERFTPLPNAFAEHNGIQVRLTEQQEGEAVLEIGPDSLNPLGRLHGGIDFIRSADHGRVTALATVRHRGGTTCQTTVEIRDEAGSLLALGDFTFFCLDHS